ncbi:MAG: ATP-binding protein [Sulfuricurvum sp.]
MTNTKTNTKVLHNYLPTLRLNKPKIIEEWLDSQTIIVILTSHDIEVENFKLMFADGIFDYFISVADGRLAIGDCPIMQSLLIYLKNKDVKAEELFEICNRFRKSVLYHIIEKGELTKELLEDLSYLFDNNFYGVLKHYSDSLYQKEQEIDRHVKILSDYQKALDESSIICKLDANGIITYVNKAYIALSGYKAEELIGKWYFDDTFVDIQDEPIDNICNELSDNSVLRRTLKKRSKNDEEYYEDVTITKISDPYDNLVEYMAIANDVTQIMDTQLQAQRDAFAKEVFLSNMSHEIRTPLNAILGFVNLLSEQELTKQQQKYLSIIQNSGENLLSIINDILDFSKLRSGEFVIEPKYFSIHEEIANTLELFVASANSKSITITSFIDPVIPKELYADVLRIKQIVSNFLSNAIKFTNNHGHIHVEASCNNKRLLISVTDNGIGISPQDRDMIFHAFTQGSHEGLQNIQGTGLGLSICFQLAKLMGGEIRLESTLGIGSTFSVELPVEVENRECQVYNNMKELIDLKILFYIQDKVLDYRSESFLKYAAVFGIDVTIDNTLNGDYDITLILEEEISPKMQEEMITSGKNFLVLTSSPDDKFEKHKNIVTIGFPIYCQKLKNAISDLLEPESKEHIKHHSQKIIYSGHILVAEDNEANQELIKVLLNKYSITYDIASNGKEAFELYKQNRYDLILMDEQMPVMSGTEATKLMLKYEKKNSLPHTPISALTANVLKGTKESSMMNGYDAFLGKPISTRELEALFKKYLRFSIIEQEDEQTQAKRVSILSQDIEMLKRELELDESEIVMLSEIYLKKTKSLLNDLKIAIEDNNFSKIAKLAHSIKGSSANFRLENIVNRAEAIEKKAKLKQKFNYKQAYEELYMLFLDLS